jgi:hypothetical protein
MATDTPMSDAVREACEREGLPVVEIRPSSYRLSDISGLPVLYPQPRIPTVEELDEVDW